MPIGCVGIDAFGSFRSNDLGKPIGCIFIMDGRLDGPAVDDNDDGSCCDGSVAPATMAAVDDDDTVASVSEVCDDDLLLGMGHP